MIPLPHLAVGLIEPVVHAVSNILDHRISTVYKANLTFLVALSQIIQALLVLPVLLWLVPTFEISAPSAALILFVAAIEFFYVYPYYWALHRTDTSVVAALFSLGKIAIPFMAWLFLGETLQIQQYVGFGIIILASLMLTFHPQSFRLNTAVWLMLGVSLLFSVENIVLKHAFDDGLSWLTFAMYCSLVECLIGLVLLSAQWRTSMRLIRELRPATTGLMCLEALFTGIGNVASTWALALLPVTVMKALTGTQPLIVFGYAKMFGRALPDFFKEDDSGVHPLVKVAAFVLMIAGAVLTMGIHETE
jgi:drug/metabolite transporter (DMT)-like permease